MKVFHTFRLDSSNHCLWRGEERVSLAPKAFDVLRYLVEHADRLVTQEEILEALWPETYVNPEVVKKYVLGIRKVLGDQTDKPVFIATVPRRGYRFIASVVDEADKPLKAVGAKSTRIGILGREAELAQMQSWLDQALGGERQTIFLTGEPGIGKTTIVQAFLEQVSDASFLVVRGQCLEHYGAAEPFLPLLDGFSRMLRSSGGTQALDLLRQQAPMWLAQMPSLISQSERENLQSQVAGSSRERMLREMAGAIESLTSLAPLLLVLEDLHWSDYSTLDLVSYLARRADPARLMIVGTYRPVDVILNDHPLKGVKRELQAHNLCHEIPLEYLAEDVIAEYLAARFPRHQLPGSLRRTIYQRTEGNPLFMVTLLDFLCNEKMIVEEQGIWKLRVDLAEVEQGVPGNLRQLIEKQIERLSADERIVLEAASVAGTECSSVAIAAGLGMPIEWVEKLCEELARRHQFLSPSWLVELPDGTITPRHRFIHVLYREVPYRLIAPRLRSQIHHRIADCGEQVYGDRKSEIAAELAMHYEQSRDWLRASKYLTEAAQNATRKSAHHEAAGLARRGLQALRSLPRSAELTRQVIALRMILIVSLMATRGFALPEVDDFAADGKDLFEQTDESPQSFNLLYLLGFSYIMRGKISPAMEIAEQLIVLAGKLNDPTLAMEAHRAMGATLIEMGKCTESLEHLDRASWLYTVNRHHPYTLNIGHDCKVLSECFAGRALWTLGFPDAALRRVQGALAFARDLAHPQSSVGAAHFACEVHQLRGEHLLARDLACQVLRLADEYGLEYWVALGKVDLGWADAELGNALLGIEEIQEGVAAYEATGGKLWSPRFLGLYAVALGKAERFEESLAVIAKALTCAEHTGEVYAIAELHRIKGELLMKSGELNHSANEAPRLKALSQARTSFADALAIADQQGARSWALRAALSMHRLDLMLGNPNHTRLSDIYSSFTEGHATADLRQAGDLLEIGSPE
jgi:DNA-binding winged helix-turn-helix (wHTH) protein/tetratricopeptide (TPR) repeat protein